MPRVPVLFLLLLVLFVSACNSGNPVAPRENPTPTPDEVTVTVTSSASQLNAGSTTGATLTVSARRRDGTAVADGTEVRLNTNLGNFGVNAMGQPLQLVTRTLAGGQATVQFFAGSTTGTANILAQIGTSVGSLNVPVVTPGPAPVADFTFDIGGLSVLFTDTSTGSPTSRTWQFGDGTTSTEQNPRHNYTVGGTFTVTLTVANNGGTSTKSKFVTVTAVPAPVADFTVSTAGLRAIFTDTSRNNPTTWSWDYGDCAENAATCRSTSRNGDHTYLRSGTYTVTLTVTNAAGSSTKSQFVTIVGEAPVADFTSTVDDVRVTFVDRSTNNPTSWLWDFGDGRTSTEQNPIHTYPAAGTYTVTLTATNAAGSSRKSQFVTVGALTAAFGYEKRGINVDFFDRSTGGPSSWIWDFGDCEVDRLACVSSLRNPSHTYTTPGTYNVTLIVTNATAQSRITLAITVP